jgi:hypothetical protein
MIEATFIQQLTSMLGPASPYLIGAGVIAGQKAVEAVGGKIGEDSLAKAKVVWSKIWPLAEKKPLVVEALKEVAEKSDDLRAEAMLSLQLEKLLADAPPEIIEELKRIVGEPKGRTEVRVVTATNGGVAVGGNVSGGKIITSQKSK